jgi:hypothetical protein
MSCKYSLFSCNSYKRKFTDDRFAGIFTSLLIPETKRKPLEELSGNLLHCRLISGEATFIMTEHRVEEPPAAPARRNSQTSLAREFDFQERSSGGTSYRVWSDNRYQHI